MVHLLNRSRGFSYIEIIVTLFLIMVILGIVLSVMVVLPANRFVAHEDIALSIANHEIEALRGGGYATVPASGSFSDSGLTQLPSGTGALTTTNYNDVTKKVVVTVSWNESGEGSRSISLTTLITQTGALP
jgi:type II secretory pathway pseudopilin PulG